MNINELISSSEKVVTSNYRGHINHERRRTTSKVLNKPFGTVLEYNKTVLYKPNMSIIEIGMHITAVTEIGKSVHYAQVALRGISMEEIHVTDLINKLKSGSKKEKFSKMEDIDIVEYINKGSGVFYNKYVIQSRNNHEIYLIIDKKIPLTSEIRVKCSCSDYYYTFAYYNASHKVHIGAKPPDYSRFSSGVNELPIRNARKNPGVCKHLMLLLSMLMKDGFLAGGSDNIVAKTQKVLSKKSKGARISKAEADKLIKELKKQNREFNARQKELKSEQVEGRKLKQESKKILRDTYSIKVSKQPYVKSEIEVSDIKRQEIINKYRK